MTALLTIVLPFFNEQGWIGRTIDSLVAQNDERFLLLLIDNGSTDGTAAAVATLVWAITRLPKSAERLASMPESKRASL